MAIYCIVFLDGKEVELDAETFSLAKVKAAYKRVKDGAWRGVQLEIDNAKSTEATKRARGI